MGQDLRTEDMDDTGEHDTLLSPAPEVDGAARGPGGGARADGRARVSARVCWLALSVTTLLLACRASQDAGPGVAQPDGAAATDDTGTSTGGSGDDGGDHGGQDDGGQDDGGGDDTGTTPDEPDPPSCAELCDPGGAVDDPEQQVICVTPEDGLGVLQDTTVPAGSSIYLREGTYGSGGAETFDCMLEGTEAAPILVRACPGERVTIDGGFDIRAGGYVHWMDLEITNSSTQRLGNSGERAGAFFVSYVPGHKVINSVIHDVGHPPIGPTGQDFDFEVYGTVFYYNGFYDLGWEQNPRGTAVYGQGSEQGSEKIVRDSVSFKNWVGGFKAWGNEAYVKNWTFDGNCAFHNPETQVFVGTLTHPAEAITISDSVHYTGVYLYQRGYGSTLLGYNGGQKGADIEVRGNVFWSAMGHAWQNAPVDLNAWEQVSFTGNQVVATHVYDGDMRALVAVQTPPDSATWDDNAYFGNTFHHDGAELGFAEWQAATGWDAGSTQVDGLPGENKVIVRPNQYQDGRANVYVLNFEGLSQVSVDLSGVLDEGDAFVVRDVEDYFEPVISGTFEGEPVDFPMELTDVAPVVGEHAHLVETGVLAHTAPEFGCFVVETVPH